MAEEFEVVDALGHGFADAEDHGGGGAEAKLVCGAVDADPARGGALFGGYAVADFVVEDEGAAVDGVETGGVQAGDGVAQREFGGGREGEDLGGREAVQPDAGEALLDAGEEGLVVVEGDVLLDAGVEEQAGGADLDGLADAGVGGVEVGVGAVEGTVDGVADDAFGMQAAAQCVGLHADADEVVGGEAVEGLLASNSHSEILRLGVGLMRSREALNKSPAFPQRLKPL